MKLPTVNSLVVSVSVLLLALLALSAHPATAQILLTNPVGVTNKFRSTTGPIIRTTTIPTRAATTRYRASTFPMFTGTIRSTEGLPAVTSASCLPKSSPMIWFVVLATSVLSLRHFLFR